MKFSITQRSCLTGLNSGTSSALLGKCCNKMRQILYTHVHTLMAQGINPLLSLTLHQEAHTLGENACRSTTMTITRQEEQLGPLPQAQMADWGTHHHQAREGGSWGHCLGLSRQTEEHIITGQERRELGQLSQTYPPHSPWSFYIFSQPMEKYTNIKTPCSTDGPNTRSLHSMGDQVNSCFNCTFNVVAQLDWSVWCGKDVTHKQ